MGGGAPAALGRRHPVVDGQEPVTRVAATEEGGLQQHRHDEQKAPLELLPIRPAALWISHQSRISIGYPECAASWRAVRASQKPSSSRRNR